MGELRLGSGPAAQPAGPNGALEALFGLSTAIRYVAFGRGGSVVSRSRAHLNGALSHESDRYEELLVNPTLLGLARRRGEIDCGGLEFLVVGYGAFRQRVLPVEMATSPSPSSVTPMPPPSYRACKRSCVPTVWPNPPRLEAHPLWPVPCPWPARLFRRVGLSLSRTPP